MSLIMILVASISVVVAALVLFLTAAVLSVDGARRSYEKAVAILERPERLSPESGTERSTAIKGLEISATAEFTDWRFPDRQRFGPGQGLPQESRPPIRVIDKKAPREGRHERHGWPSS